MMSVLASDYKRVDKPIHFLSKKVGMAIGDYDMLQDGDRVLVGVSGGKDSFTLLKLLRYRQTFAPIHFDILPVHVDLGFKSNFSHMLKEYFESQAIDYRIEKYDILSGENEKDINCFWCSWNRRKVLFNLAEDLGFNKIALGHHLDDIAETILINLFYQAQISAMMPKQDFFGGKLSIIRPLAYIKEYEIKRAARLANDFEHSDCSCPNYDDTRRSVMKKIIKDLEKDYPRIKQNIIKGVKRVKTDYLL